MTCLRIRHRAIHPDDLPAYQSAWDELATTVRSIGGRAWVFRSTDASGRYIEFIEYAAGLEAAIDSGTMLAEHALETIAANAPAGTWEEWTSR